MGRWCCCQSELWRRCGQTRAKSCSQMHLRRKNNRHSESVTTSMLWNVPKNDQWDAGLGVPANIHKRMTVERCAQRNTKVLPFAADHKTAVSTACEKAVCKWSWLPHTPCGTHTFVVLAEASAPFQQALIDLLLTQHMGTQTGEGTTHRKVLNHRVIHPSQVCHWERKAYETSVFNELALGH